MTQPHPAVSAVNAAPPLVPMLQLSGVSKRYALGPAGPGTHIVASLEGVNLSVQRGEFVAVMGPSGSGKSTLLNILGALDTPTEGTYTLEGHDITHLPDRELARIRNRHFGFVFQAYNLFPELTALENVALPLVYAGVPARERRARAMAQLEAVGLSGRAGHRPGQLSGGEQQRVAMARALVTGPTLLLADEPTGNLSREGGAVILDLLGKLHAEGTSIVMVTHDEAVGAHARRVLRLADGQVVGDEGGGQAAAPGRAATA